ncbi:MAG: SGNH/GDSL hydrolase family protein, partial [Prolixibacteraceae bacterium]
MKKTITWTFVVLTGIILLYLWVGFFLPNPAMESWDTWYKYRIVLWLPRIIIPLLYCIILLMVFTKDRKLSQNIATLLGTFLILFLVAASLIYVNKSKTRSGYIKDQYHPYLQILPPTTADLNKASGKKAIRIFCLGGSTTAWKNSKNVGWPESLEKELRQFYHSDSIFVFNFGIPWYTTLHTLINFETNLRQHKPDVIIVMHNINDFLQNADFSYLSNGSFRQDYGHFLG